MIPVLYINKNDSESSKHHAGLHVDNIAEDLEVSCYAVRLHSIAERYSEVTSNCDKRSDR